MKNLLTLFGVMCTFIICYSQEGITKSMLLEKYSNKFEYDSLLNINSKKEKNNKYIPLTLNYLIKDQVNSFMFTANNVSTTKYFVSLTNEENEFSFGANLNLNRNPMAKQTWQLSLGVNAKSKSGFATVFKNGERANDISFQGKILWIGNGIVRFNEAQHKIDSTYINKLLIEKYRGKLSKYLIEEGDFDKQIKIDEIFDKKSNMDSLVGAKTVDLLVELAKENATEIENRRLYKKLWSHNISVDYTLPFSKTGYILGDSLNSSVKRDTIQYNWNVALQYTTLLKLQNQSKFYFSLRAKVFNSNSIADKRLSGTDFLSFVNQGAGNQAVTESKKVYVGDFEKYIAFSPSAEFIYIPFGLFFGASASVEYQFGGIDAINWKLGIPLIFKDKDEKPLINLELQWKEVQKNHFIGLRVGFVLGKYVR